MFDEIYRHALESFSISLCTKINPRKISFLNHNEKKLYDLFQEERRKNKYSQSATHFLKF